MASELLQKLEKKIENAVETIELLQLQVEELEDKNVKLNNENTSLKNRQAAWEKNLHTMLDKLSTVSAGELPQKKAAAIREEDFAIA